MDGKPKHPVPVGLDFRQNPASHQGGPKAQCTGDTATDGLGLDKVIDRDIAVSHVVGVASNSRHGNIVANGVTDNQPPGVLGSTGQKEETPRAKPKSFAME